MFALTGISENLAFSTLGEMSAVARQEHLDAKRRYRKLDRTYPLTRAVSMGRFGTDGTFPPGAHLSLLVETPAVQF